MYANPRHRLTDRDALHSLMESHPLGAWVCHGPSGLVANHVPFLLDRSRGPHGALIGHVARANPVWRDLDPSVPSVVMFQGAQSYISPNWYPSKAEHGKVVPTWNYLVVHAHGIARVTEDRDWMLDMLNRITDSQEARGATPWRVGDAPAEHIEQMMRAVVGIEIPIDRLEGKLKASQDEALQDRLGVVRGLQKQSRHNTATMADLVMKAIDSEPKAN